jgi:thioredoxin 1
VQIVLIQYVKQHQTSWHRLCKSPVAVEQSNEKMNLNETITEATFEAEVVKSEQPVLVVFGTPWSRPCQVLDPILEDLARDWEGNVKVVKINADDSLDLSLCYDIQSIPTLIYFVEGKPCFRIVGTASKEAILFKLKALGDMNEMVAPAMGASGERRQPGKEN